MRAEFKLAVLAMLEPFQLDLSTTITPGSAVFHSTALHELLLAIISSGSPLAADLGRSRPHDVFELASVASEMKALLVVWT